MPTSSWVAQSFIALFCLIPAWLAIGFFDRNFKVSSDVFLFWYMLGIIIALACFKGFSGETIGLPWKMAGAILIIGLTVGAIANIMIFRAVAGAPNPGLALSIANAANVGVFLAAFALSLWAPSYFNSAKFDSWSFLGVMLVVVGVSIVVIRR